MIPGYEWFEEAINNNNKLLIINVCILYVLMFLDKKKKLYIYEYVQQLYILKNNN